MNRDPAVRAIGIVVAVRGSVVDMRFDVALPAIHSLLRAGDGRRVAIEVLAQRDARHVRGIALNPTQGLARGMPVAALMDRAPVSEPLQTGLKLTDADREQVTQAACQSLARCLTEQESDPAASDSGPKADPTAAK